MQQEQMQQLQYAQMLQLQHRQLHEQRYEQKQSQSVKDKARHFLKPPLPKFPLQDPRPTDGTSFATKQNAAKKASYTAPSVILNLVDAAANPLQCQRGTLPYPPQDTFTSISTAGARASDDMLNTSVLIRNTFLDTRPMRSPSLEPFFRERQIKSTPPSPPPSCKLEHATPIPLELDNCMFPTPTGSISETMIAENAPCQNTLPVTNMWHQLQVPHTRFQVSPAPHGYYTKGQPCLGVPFAFQQDQPKNQTYSSSASGGPASSTSTASAPSSRFGSFSRSPATSNSHATSNTGSVDISNAAHNEASIDATRTEEDKPPLGSTELPSRGSALHRWAACKPCAFVLQDACQNGVECQFCHLCEPGEKKRRKKERQEMKREARLETRQSRSFANSWRSNAAPSGARSFTSNRRFGG